MSGSSRPPPALQAAALAELLASTDPAAAEQRAASASRHFERTRRAAVRPPTLASGPKPQRPSASPTPAPARPSAGAQTYLHRGPTRSPVMNAFLHGLGDLSLVPVDASFLDEHVLAPRLVEHARRYWPKMLLAAGNVPAMLAVAEQTVSIENEGAARFLMLRATAAGGSLAEIAHEYAAHRRELGAQAPDDRLGQCMMATFAGQMLRYARKLLGSYVRDDLRTELQGLFTETNAPLRRRAVRALETPPDAEAAHPPARWRKG